jgi:hypothetical protein
LPAAEDAPQLSDTFIQPVDNELLGISVQEDLFSFDDEPELPLQTEIVQPQVSAAPNPEKRAPGKVKKAERESISKWFNQQFGDLFSDNDEEVK